MTSARLSQRRAELGLTRTEFGEIVGVSASDVLRWERGIAPMPDAFVLSLAVAYAELCVEAKRRRPRRAPAESIAGEKHPLR